MGQLKTIGFLLASIGLIGGVVAYGSILYYNEISFVKMGVLSNLIQVIGLGCIYLEEI